MVHPVADASAVAGLTRIGKVSQAEYEILLSPEFKRGLQKSGAQLARYAHIPPVRILPDNAPARYEDNK